MTLHRILLLLLAIVLTVFAEIKHEPYLGIINDENYELTADDYRLAFLMSNRTHFYPFKYYTLILQRRAMSNLALKKIIWPICLVKLINNGKGLVLFEEDCLKNMEEVEKVDPTLLTLELPYRCYDGYDGHFDEYKLRFLQNVELSTQPFKDQSALMVSFTPEEEEKDEDDCHPIFAEDIGDNEELEATRMASKDFDAVVNLEGALPLTKQHFEETIPLPEIFHLNRQLTYIYMRDEEDRKNLLLVPIKKCIVSIFEKGKGSVHPGCADAIKWQKKLYLTYKSLLLPLRCFYHDNALDYELQTTQIDRIEYEEDQYVIYFQVPESEHCSPKWGSNEDLGKTEDEEEYNFEADIIKDEL